ncbi:hypothetical protein BKA67DRAFT_518387 [Truncatella angustata]|uniref:PH domain-containing protein n=1 Tax=Truncatella angustata TaxID=152316 RepID=A0A9P8UL22_9PEZI|nr:uncharacterized protein BKA67DRAFT_518387 [Truncatella angustata]KAH6654068.1 hypothetical protein BKA67DRAFT_518387 [Truncatella angustata]
MSQVSSASETDVTSSYSTRRRSTLSKIRPPDFAKQDLARQLSKASSDYTEVASSSTRPTTPSGGGSRGTSLSDKAATVLKSGPLKEESSVLKNKKEYLVLTPAGLFKFRNRLAAIEQFPQVAVPTSAVEALSPVETIASFQEIGAKAEAHIPLERIVSIFKDEGTKPCFGLEVWWKESCAAGFFANIELNFSHPGDRDDWLKQIQYAVRQKTKALAADDSIPSELELDLACILEAKYPHQSAHLDIFPVVPRRPFGRLRSNNGEIKKGWRENSSFYMAFSKNICFLAHFTRSPTGQKVNPSIVQYGLVTISKVNAHTHDERFDLVFRLPLDTPRKLELSSRHHRNIVSRLFKSDTYLKPAWPLSTRREIFLVEGDSHQMPLPSGEDYGGFKRTLEAFLEGYHSVSVQWKVNWRNVKYAPEFQLLPSTDTPKYTAYQLLAVFRALRFNDFFKSLSFRGVDFSALSNVFDNSCRMEPTVWLSRTGKRSLTRDEFEVVEKSSVLFQEVIAMLLGSESIRHADFTAVLPKAPVVPTPGSSPTVHQGCEVVPPVVLLIRSLQSRCKSIILNGNYIGHVDVSEIHQTLQSQPNYLRGLGLSRCQLDEMSMITLWEGIHEQRQSLEHLELSSNFGCLEASRVSQTLWDTSNLRRLDLSSCLKGIIDGPLFRPWTTSPYEDPWSLEEVDLSGWKINFDTVSSFVRYLEVDESSCLRHLKLNSCGISGEVATAIFCRIGSGRDIHLYLNSNPLETGSTDWVDLIHGNEAPKRLHLDMIEFKHESNFDKLLTALADNNTIELLSLVGTGPPGRASPKTSSLFSAFLEKNRTLRYLDFSGYSGKLEDAHLGWGLSGALGGLKSNKTLRQLRIRNHDMGAAEDITELCRVIAQNQGLAMLDMQNNNFDHHQFSKVIHALELNRQIISFPISSSDRDHVLAKEKQAFSKSLKKSLKGSLGKSDSARLNSMLEWLRGHWDSEVKKAEDILQRNRDDYLNQALELDTEFLSSWDDAQLPSWLSRKPSGRDTTRARDSMISMSSTSSMLNENPSSPMLSTHKRSFSGRGFAVASEPAIHVYTVEEEESSTNPSPGIVGAARTGSPVEISHNDQLWMRKRTR